MAFIDDDRTMMCLAGLSYRGFWRVGWGDAHVREIATGISQGLEDLELTNWKIVWGPACYRPPLGWFDDVVMYVVHDSSTNPARYVIVIRGTNPISLSDWILGDLLTNPPVPWPFDRAAHITPSTAQGLAVLLALGAEPQLALRRVRPLLDGVDFAKAEDSAASVLGRYRRLRLHHTGLRPVMSVFSALRRRGNSSAWVGGTLRNEIQAGQTMAGAQMDLIGYLKEAVRTTGNLEIVVTGHSKGGALAAALTAWLAQSRADGPNEGNWDPESKVRLRCLTFAGPTPGDDRFNNLLLQKLGPGDFRRIWNRWDIVPHAFGWNDLEAIRTIYDAVLIEPLLEKLREAIRNDDYSQIGPGLPFPEDPNPPSQKLSLLNAVDNHMENYLKRLNISHSTGWFFLGTEPGPLVRWVLRLDGHR
jgi:hypothetical protein